MGEGCLNGTRECSKGSDRGLSRLYGDALSALADTCLAIQHNERAPPYISAAPVRIEWRPVACILGPKMNLAAAALALMVVVLIGVIPTWHYSRTWGYAPAGIVGAEVLVLLTLLLMGRI